MTVLIRPSGTVVLEGQFRKALCFTRESWCFYSFASGSPNSVGRSPWNFPTWTTFGCILSYKSKNSATLP